MPDPVSRDWTRDLHARLVDLRLSPEREAEIVEELSQHLDDRYDELRAGGSTDTDARRLALEELRDTGEIARRMRALAQARTPPPLVPGEPRPGLLNGLWHDMRYAVRAARQQSAFTAAVVLTLACGLAVNTTVFTIANAAVIRPLPFDDPERVVRLGVTNVETAQTQNLSYLDLQDWRAARETFAGIAASTERGVSLSGDDRPAAYVAAEHVSWNTFSLLGERPILGRDFGEPDDRAGAAPVAILSGDLWRTRYGADPGIIGRTVRISGVPSTIVGVMPPGFGFPDNADLWLPLAALEDAARSSRGARVLSAYGRLRPGATIEQATTELTGIAASLAEQYPETNRGIVPRVTPASIAEQLVLVVFALLGAVGFVLLIACANVANLLLARATDRTRDVGLRLALGASRWRVVRQLLVESLGLAAAGALCGLALAYAGIQLLLSNMPPEAAPPYFIRFTMDRTVFLYLALLATGSALVCSLVPAWHASRTDLTATVNETGRASAGGRSRHWTGAFVVAQVALALVLLTGAGLMVRNLMNQVGIDVGVETADLLQTRVDLRTYGDAPERRRLFLEQLEARLASSPVVDATLASHMPMGGAFPRRVRTEIHPADAPADSLPIVSLVLVGPDYFDVTPVPAVPGLGPAADALRPGDDRVVVNERFAAMFVQDGPAVGRRFLLLGAPGTPGTVAGADRWMTIAGVVRNVRQRQLPDGTYDPVVYRSYAEEVPPVMTVLSRSASGSAMATSFVSEQVRAADADVPAFGAGTVDDALLRQLWPQRVFGSLFAVFASMAMLLATCGLYAVTAYAVSRRTREIGVRVALGADGRHVWWTLMRRTLGQIGIGLVLGVAGAAAISAVLPAILVGTDRMDPLVFAGVAAVLLATGVAASSVPARKAMRVDPMTTLRAE